MPLLMFERKIISFFHSTHTTIFDSVGKIQSSFAIFKYTLSLLFPITILSQFFSIKLIDFLGVNCANAGLCVVSSI